MRLGLHVADFTNPGGPTRLREDLVRVATEAEEGGYRSLSVMDHLWQIAPLGPPELPMLEAYTTLGFLAARTERVELLAWVSAVTYREPGMLAKLVTTLDVLSGGRAWLGIGAAWFEEEAAGLGLPFPPTAERFERLEETLRICLQMWAEDDSAFAGEHYSLARTLNHPPAVRRPHPPILIGGSGERKTLKLVARYAQACNLFGGPETAHKLDVLRRHCETEGRDYDDVEKTVMVAFTPCDVDGFLETARGYADLGVQHLHGAMPGYYEPGVVRAFGLAVVPALAEL